MNATGTVAAGRREVDEPSTENARVRTGTSRRTPPLLGTSAVALVLVLALVKGLSPFFEPDVWWHLRVGDLLRQTGEVRFPDPSATFANRDYVATQWLPEVVTSVGHAALGMGFVLWLRSLAVLALVCVVYLSCRRYAGRLPAAVVSGLTLLGAGGGLNPRPQLVSFVLFAITVHAWCGMAADRRTRWWLVPVFWLWASSHGLWTFGLAVGAVLLVAIVVDPRTRPRPRELSRLGGLWGACLLVTAVTPLGPSLLLTPFQVAGNASMIAEEWRATPLNNVFSWAALLMVTGCAVLWSWAPRRRPWWQLALLGFAAFCTLWMWRLVPLGCIAAAPLLAGALQQHLTADREAVTRTERRALLVGSAFLVALAAGVSATSIGTDAQKYPGRMTSVERALGTLPRRTVVLDDFGISGWLLWRHPDLVPAADLRGEIYSAEHLRAYQDTLRVEPGWQQFIVATDSGAALLSRESALADALVDRLGWTTMATSGDFVLLRRPAG